MTVEDKLTQKKKRIDRRLDQILSGDDSRLLQAMRYAVLSGGKRFRPMLMLSAGECFGMDGEIVLPFACALELIHNYSLVHDDLPAMDNDDFRREQPSCHRAFGEDIALLAGDGLLTLAFEVMAQASIDDALLTRKAQSIGEISRFAGIQGMIGGQLLDISLSPDKISEEEFYTLILKKTGALIIASMRVGAILGGASPSKIDAISEYGKNIGLAFQTRDDILDSIQDTKEDQHFRPNSVTLFGLEEAGRKLKNYVNTGINSLVGASIESAELRFLASKLLEIKEGSK